MHANAPQSYRPHEVSPGLGGRSGAGVGAKLHRTRQVRMRSGQGRVKRPSALVMSGPGTSRGRWNVFYGDGLLEACDSLNKRRGDADAENLVLRGPQGGAKERAP